MKQKIFRKTVYISPYRLFQHTCLNLIQCRQIKIQHHSHTPDLMDPALNLFHMFHIHDINKKDIESDVLKNTYVKFKLHATYMVRAEMPDMSIFSFSCAFFFFLCFSESKV